MKDLNYYICINSKKANPSEYITLIENDISGGRISKESIDKLKKHPNVTEISISGLTQETFDYFIENYGKQFKAINFWKCPLVENLSKIELLENIEYITYFWNQRTERLWNFKKTKSLKGFCFDDFTRMHDISDISNSETIVELEFGDKIWTKYILNSLTPIEKCTSLKKLSFSAKKIIDEKIQPLSKLKQLEILEFPSNQFTTEQVSWLKAHLPSSVKSKILNPYYKVKPLEIDPEKKDTIIVGKRKPFLNYNNNKNKVEKYIDDFNKMYQFFLDDLNKEPEEYKK